MSGSVFTSNCPPILTSSFPAAGRSLYHRTACVPALLRGYWLVFHLKTSLRLKREFSFRFPFRAAAYALMAPECNGPPEPDSSV